MHNALTGKGIRNGRDIQPQNQGMSIRKIRAKRHGTLRDDVFTGAPCA